MIYMAVKSEADAKLLQADLNKLTDWEGKWMMQFGPDVKLLPFLFTTTFCMVTSAVTTC
jgi:hypothetical protein